MTYALAALAALSLLACESERRPAPAPAASPVQPAPLATAPASASADDDLSSLRFPAAPRVVAIGDLHGDLAAARAALRLAGAIDAADRWVGEKLVVVQTGDEIDRGDSDRAIIDLFDKLIDEAAAAGGAVHALNGNHEVMNVAGDFRYVTEVGFRGFTDVSGLALSDPRIATYPEAYRPRAAAFMPGGPYAKRLARRSIVAIVGDSVFVHGGVLPSHVRYGLGKLDREVRAWMDGGSKPPQAIQNDDGPVWTRRYSDQPGPRDCELLGEALAALRAKRMVVGHTVQKGGIAPACDGRVQRIDVGLSSFYGGRPEVLEIAGDAVKVLREKKAP